MNGAQALINSLLQEGVDHIFGYAGATICPAVDALKAHPEIGYTLVRSEQNAGHMASGYARVSGKVGVCMVTSGPGATNLITGIATAYMDSIPMVAITGQVPSHLLGRDIFQEVDITGITMPITKHNFIVKRVEDLADTIREAFQVAKSGRPGPVLIDIPKDVQMALAEFQPQGIVPYQEQALAEDVDIDRAVELINKAERPYIYIGGGAAGAGLAKEIMALAEKIDGYIGCSFMGLSTMSNSYERFLGMEGMHGHYASSMANKDADLIIGVGVRFSDRATGNVSKYAKTAKIIQLDADISEINKNVRVDVGLVGNIVSSFTRILQRCAEKKHPEWQEQIQGYIARGKEIAAENEDVLDEIEKMLKEKGYLV